MKTIILSFVAALALGAAVALALPVDNLQAGAEPAQHSMRGCTAWTPVTPRTYWPGQWGDTENLPQEVVLGTITLPPGGKLTIRQQVAFIVITENKWDTFIDGYQVGSGFTIRAGEAGSTLCNNMCSGALGPNPSAAHWTPPQPLPTTMLGFPAGTYPYHYVPIGISGMPTTASVGAGPLEIRGTAYHSMQTWNGEDNPNQSHGWDCEVIVLERAIWSWAPPELAAPSG